MWEKYLKTKYPVLVICLLLTILLVSCSRKTEEEKRRENIKPSSGLPFKISVATSPEAKDQANIWALAIKCLKNKQFDELESMSDDYRSSKDSYANGTWKLQYVYGAFTATPDLTNNAAWLARQQELQDWINAKPKSPTARIAMATFLTTYAWCARGSGYADTVSDKAGRLFNSRLNQGWSNLIPAGRLTNQCPAYWPTLMLLAVGLQLDRTNFDNLFRHAVEAAPGFPEIYKVRAMYLLPRWYGEPGDFERDLTNSTDGLGGEKGDMLYAQVVWAVNHFGTSSNLFDEYPLISWDRVQRGFDVIEKQFPHTLAVENERAHLAALAGDLEDARKYFEKTGGKVDLSCWNEEGEYIDFANWSYK